MAQYKLVSALYGKMYKYTVPFFDDFVDLFPDKPRIFRSNAGTHVILPNLDPGNYVTGIPDQLFTEMNDTGLSIGLREVDYPEFQPRQKYYARHQVMNSVELPVENDRYEQISRELYGRVLKSW